MWTWILRRNPRLASDICVDGDSRDALKVTEFSGCIPGSNQIHPGLMEPEYTEFRYVDHRQFIRCNSETETESQAAGSVGRAGGAGVLGAPDADIQGAHTEFPNVTSEPAPPLPPESGR